MNKTLHFSSKDNEWETPQELFDELNKLYGPFLLDAAATSKNTKCAEFYSKGGFTNALSENWCRNRVWLNPPYGKWIGEWLKKAYMESQKDSRVVCLIPSRTDTKWWHEYVMLAKEVLFIKGRVKFVGAEHSAPFPSAVVIFEKGNHETKFACLSLTRRVRIL